MGCHDVADPRVDACTRNSLKNKKVRATVLASGVGCICLPRNSSQLAGAWQLKGCQLLHTYLGSVCQRGDTCLPSKNLLSTWHCKLCSRIVATVATGAPLGHSLPLPLL